jgi:hypothetical protein
MPWSSTRKTNPLPPSLAAALRMCGFGLIDVGLPTRNTRCRPGVSTSIPLEFPWFEFSSLSVISSPLLSHLVMIQLYTCGS